MQSMKFNKVQEQVPVVPQWKNTRCVAIFVSLGLMTSACQPSVKIESSADPIQINLNVNLDADVRVRLSHDAHEDAQESNIF